MKVASMIVYREKILEAAIRCFEKYGVQRATLSDVADEAGLSRKTVYRVFDDRSALLVAILTQRFAPMVEAMRDHVAQFARLEEALVEGPIFVLHHLRQDTLYLDIINKMTNRGVEDRILGANTGVETLLNDVWNPLFERARISGELTGSRSNDRLIEGVRVFSGLLGLRMDLSEGDQRQFLRDFLVPAILKKEVD